MLIQYSCLSSLTWQQSVWNTTFVCSNYYMTNIECQSYMPQAPLKHNKKHCDHFSGGDNQECVPKLDLIGPVSVCQTLKVPELEDELWHCVLRWDRTLAKMVADAPCRYSSSVHPQTQRFYWARNVMIITFSASSVKFPWPRVTNTLLFSLWWSLLNCAQSRTGYGRP